MSGDIYCRLNTNVRGWGRAAGLHLTGTLGHQNRSASCQNKSPSPSPARSSWWLQQSPAALQCQCREDLPCSRQQPALSTGGTIHGRYWKLEGQFSQNTQPALFLYTINAHYRTFGIDILGNIQEVDKTIAGFSCTPLHIAPLGSAMSLPDLQ